MDYAPPPPSNSILVAIEAYDSQDWGTWHAAQANEAWSRLGSSRFGMTLKTISGSLTVGPTIYPLRSAFVGYFYPGQPGESGKFVVPAFGSVLIGRGSHIEQAFLDWRESFHRLFQELYAKRPFELNSNESVVWRNIQERIDVVRYRNATPLVQTQVGTVLKTRGCINVIKWEDGTSESVALEKAPAEFASYKPGQPFESLVSRDPLDFRILELKHVRRRKSFRRLSDQEREELISSLPTSESLPAANWD